MEKKGKNASALMGESLSEQSPNGAIERRKVFLLLSIFQFFPFGKASQSRVGTVAGQFLAAG